MRRTGDLLPELRDLGVRYCVVFNDFVAETDFERAVQSLAERGELIAEVAEGRGARIFALDLSSDSTVGSDRATRTPEIDR